MNNKHGNETNPRKSLEWFRSMDYLHSVHVSLNGTASVRPLTNTIILDQVQLFRLIDFSILSS